MRLAMARKNAGRRAVQKAGGKPEGLPHIDAQNL
jgi:hypothetical protein